MPNYTRRNFIKASTVIGSATFLSPIDLVSMPTGQSIIKVRKDVNTLDVSDPIIQTYISAVEKMKALPDTNPFSWNQQARIHQTHCPHNNWFFLPWHRAYLYYFEEIIRQVSGNNDFALPYWDWTKDTQIPSIFWSGALNNNTRSVGRNDSLPLEDTGQPVVDRIMKEKNFELMASGKPFSQRNLDPIHQRRQGATGPLERTPHNGVHVWVSGQMVTMMSPLDPIFWLHHCNVDRLWAKWNSLGNANTTNTLWKDFTFEGNFYDKNQNQRDVKVGTTEDTLALGYRYESINPILPQQSSSAVFTSLSQISPNNTFEFDRSMKISLNEATNLPVGVNNEFIDQIKNFKNFDMPDPQRTFALIEGITPPTNPNVRLRVFLNCDYLSPSTPIHDPHYVSSINFFGTHHADDHTNHGKLTHAFDITDTITRLNRINGINTDELNVQLLPLALDGRDVSETEINVEAVKILFS